MSWRYSTNSTEFPRACSPIEAQGFPVTDILADKRRRLSAAAAVAVLARQRHVRVINMSKSETCPSLKQSRDTPESQKVPETHPSYKQSRRYVRGSNRGRQRLSHKQAPTRDKFQSETRPIPDTSESETTEPETRLCHKHVRVTNKSESAKNPSRRHLPVRETSESQTYPRPILSKPAYPALSESRARDSRTASAQDGRTGPWICGLR